MNDATKNAFKKWYEKDKDKLSEKRKQRYQTDPEYRAKCLARAAQRRAEFPKPPRAGEARFKEIDGKPREVFRIGEVSQMIGIGLQTIRSWEASGTIPGPSIESAQRLYTGTQIALMRELAALSHQHRYDRENRASVIAEMSAQVWQKWNQEE